MFLVKCKCGCEYKFPEKLLDNVYPEQRKCPACGEKHPFSKEYLIADMESMAEGQSFEIFRVPDDIKI